VTTRHRLLAVYLVALVGMASLAGGLGFVGTAAADAPDCGTVSYQGAGTSASPLQVGNVAQLQCIGENHADATDQSDALSSSYELVSDIDATETSQWNPREGGRSRGFDPIGDSEFGSNDFTGTFDGNGYAITGLTIDRPDTSYVGLFGYVSDSGTIQNVTLENVDVTGDAYVGSLVGRNVGTVERSSASGRVEGTYDVGGLVGRHFGGEVGSGTIRESYVTAGVTGDDTVGGLVGYNGGGDEITKSYATGDVTANGGEGDVGGLAGASAGSITQSYATGEVTGGSNQGGLVGTDFDSTITNSYWDTEATGRDAGGEGAIGLTTDEMQRFAPLETMSGFDFGGTWNITDGYPRLAWENADELAVDSLDTGSVTVDDEEGGTITVTATVSGSSDPSGATVEVVDGDGLAGLSAGDTVETDADGEATFTFSESASGTYTPEFDWARNADVTATSTVTVLATPEGTASLDADILTEDRGDVVDVTVSLDGTDRATVTIGDRSETDWAQNISVADGDGDGTVTIEFNTYTAGTSDNGYRVYSLADPDDSIVNLAPGSGDLFFVDTPGEATLGADDYPIRAVAGTVPASSTLDGPDDVATLSLGTASADAVTTYTAPGARAGDIESVADVAALRADGTITETSVVEMDELLVVGVEAGGLEGVIENRTDRSAENATVAFLNEGADRGSSAAYAFTVTQTNPGPNANAYTATLAPNNTAVIPDPANDTYWLVVDTGSVTEFGTGDELETNLTLRAGGSLVDGDRTALDEWRIPEEELVVEDPTATLETNAVIGGEDALVLRSASGQTLTGSATVEPGTEIRLRVTGADEGAPFVKPLSTTVQADGTFTVTSDFSDHPPVANFSVTLRNESGDLMTEPVPGRIVAPFEVTDEEYAVASGETLSVPATEGVLSSAQGATGVTLTAARTERPAHGTLSLSPDGSFEYTPDCEFSGEDTFSYEVSDGAGNTDTATATVSVTSAGPADFSVAVDEANYSVRPGETVVVETTVTNEGGVCDTQTVALTNVSGETVDTRSVTLVPGESRTVTLDWATSTDTESGEVTVASANDTAWHSVTIPTDAPVGTSDDDAVETGDAPVASADAYTVVAPVGEETQFAVTAEDGVLANDDAPTNAASELSVSLVDGPTNGSLALDADGSFTYRPDVGFTGRDSFAYAVSDGDGDRDRARVALTVVDAIQHTVYPNASAVRQHVDVPADATPTAAERVTFLVPLSGPRTVHVGEHLDVSTIRFGPGADLRGSLTVTEFDSEASLPETLPGQPLVSLRVAGSESDEDAPTTAHTRVARSDLPAGATATDLRVARYLDGAWELSNVTVVNRTDGGVTVAFDTDGFGVYAVTAVDTPAASISAPETVTADEELTLDASASSAPYGDLVSYEWSVVGRNLSGETATLALEESGEYTVELRVTSDAGRTATTTTTLTVEDAASTPATTPSTPTPTTTAGDRWSPTTAGDGSSSPATTADGPGFGSVAVAVAILGLALAVRRR